MDIMKDAYREEAYEILASLEEALLALEEVPEDMGIIGRVFRSMHTLKGSGAMFGFDDIAHFTHTIENVYDLVRSSEVAVTQDLISLTLSACDQIKIMLEASLGRAEVDASRTEALSLAFQCYLPDADETPQQPKTKEPEPVVQEKKKETLKSFRIWFEPVRTLFDNGTNPIPLLNELRSMGDCTITAEMPDLPSLEEIDPGSCYTAWDIVLTTGQDINAIQDVFIFVEDLCTLKISPIESKQYDDPSERRVGDILVERGDLQPDAVEETAHKQKRLGELLVESGTVPPSKVASALREQTHLRDVKKKQTVVEESSSVRVPAVKLDSLVNLVGELVTVQARLTSLADTMGDSELKSVAEDVEGLSAELRDISMGIRMLPIGTTFSKYKRLVRDLSTELGKEILFEMEGEETELDKTVIEKLSDPLVHLIRNSIDHGVEKPEDRKKAGKPAQGTIRLSAQHSGAYVLISVTDDGAGLNVDAIRQKAIQKGIINEETELNTQEMYSLIFAPGFSTAVNVTSVSGRGVGMDVVKSSIESLGGSIDIQSSPGSGTSITLKLPLTLAIIDGLLVKIEQEFFVLPLGLIVECVELTDENIQHAHGRHLIKVRDEIVPYIYLRERFDIRGKRPGIEQVVITDISDKRLGFVVDKVVGQHQTVIKNLGKFFKEIHGVSGATIMGDGNVALILDVNKMMQDAEAESC